ncbi:MAG TPA: hypothetical protein VGM63_00490, partial [Mucilaginibacter sp.]
KQSLISGALLYQGTGILRAATNDRFSFSSKFIKLELDPAYPKLIDFGVDSLGGSQFNINPLLQSENAQSLVYSSRVDRNTISYYLKDHDEKPTWKVKCEEKKITINTQYVGGVSKTEPFVISIAQQINHSTALGIITPESKLKFPCLLHLPGRGTFRIHCSDPEVELYYDAYRFHAAGDKGVPFVKVEFKAADDKNKAITYTLEAVSVSPELKSIHGDDRFDGIRRNFINIFQLNPRMKVLANNSASDPCAFTLFLYAEMARRTPELAHGLSALDLIRSSLDVYLGGMKGYGQVGFFYNNKYGWLSIYDSSDSSPSLIISACYYILDTKDKTWARNNYAGIKAWATKMIKTDTNNDGIIEYGHSGNSGSWDKKPFQRPSNWWDAIGFGHDDAYSNALAYRAIKLLSEVALTIGETDDSAYYSSFAAKLKSNYYKHFYNPDTGVLAGWRSEDGKLHDYYFTFVNGVAICYGLLTAEQGKQVMQRMLQKMKEVGYTNFKMGLPGNLIPVPPVDYVGHEKRWGYGEKPDGSDGFQIYENGGATGCYAYYTIKALYDLGMRKEADEIFLPMLESFKESGFEGHCEGSNFTKDWKTWDGKCWGYEGFLVDNYLPLLAIYDWKA